MHVTRRALVLGLVLVSFGLAPAYAAPPSRLTLRYHFVAGQMLTYAVTQVTKEVIREQGQPVDSQVATAHFQIHYLIRLVTATGDARLSITFGHADQVVVHNGRTTRGVPEIVTQPIPLCSQQVDGTQVCTYRGAFGVNDLGQLPATPVSVGGSWTSHIDNNFGVGGRGPLVLHSTLRGISPGAGGQIAAIDSAAALQGRTQFGTSGKRYSVSATVSEQGRWQFALGAGRFLGETLRQLVTSTGSVTERTGTYPVTMTMQTDTTMQLLSVAGKK